MIPRSVYFLILFPFLLSVSGAAPDKKRSLAVSDDGLTPEERKGLVSEVVDHLYKQGLDALTTRHWEQAETFFDRVLVLQPKHVGAQRGIDRVMREYEKREPPAPPKKVVDPQTHQGALQKKPVILRNLYNQAVARGEDQEKKGNNQDAIDAYQLALSYRSNPTLKEKVVELQAKVGIANKKESDVLYLEALKASQSNQPEQALELCQKALRLNPKNIQAKRMRDRFLARIKP
jgi:tetratricopeptide (TPR) repeat protein